MSRSWQLTADGQNLHLTLAHVIMVSTCTAVAIADLQMAVLTISYMYSEPLIGLLFLSARIYHLYLFSSPPAPCLLSHNTAFIVY